MSKYFKLTNETKINLYGVKLFRIECIVKCKWANVGDKGGWVENENNISGNAWVSDDAEVFGNAEVSGNAWVSDDARVFGNAWVFGNARISGDARVSGDAWVSDDAEVFGNADYCCFCSFGSGYRTITAHKDVKIGLRINCGCFSGSLSEFATEVKQTHGDNKFAKVYNAIIDVIKLKFDVQ